MNLMLVSGSQTKYTLRSKCVEGECIIEFITNKKTHKLST